MNTKYPFPFFHGLPDIIWESYITNAKVLQLCLGNGACNNIVAWKSDKYHYFGLKRVNPNYPFSFHGLCLPGIIWNSYIGCVTVCGLEIGCVTISWLGNLVCNNNVAWKSGV